MNKSYLTYAVAGAAGAIVALALPLLLTTSRAETKLLPFQGRLTDAVGTVIPDGAKVVEFKMYDAPTGGTVKWVGEVHKLSVNGGLVNTMLGSKAGLGGVDFSTPTYLQITIDTNHDNQVSAADPPLLPRQSVIGAVYASEAGNTRKLAGNDWSALLEGGSNNPLSATIRGDKLTPNSVTSDKIPDNSIAALDLTSIVRDALVPSGTILAYGGTAAPPGFKMCDGASYP
ncbi:MAG: tail fiber protein, partial [Verrucomicrobiaceae bacterium]